MIRENGYWDWHRRSRSGSGHRKSAGHGCMKRGVNMGISEALKDEVTFDQRNVTRTSWNRYRILTMAEIPELKVVQFRATTQDLAEAQKRLLPFCPGRCRRIRRCNRGTTASHNSDSHLCDRIARYLM